MSADVHYRATTGSHVLRPGIVAAAVLLTAAGACLVASLLAPWGDSVKPGHIHVAQTVVGAGSILLGAVALGRSITREQDRDQTAWMSFAVAMLAGAALWKLWQKLDPHVGQAQGAFLIVMSCALTVVSALVLLLSVRFEQRTARGALAAGVGTAAVVAAVVLLGTLA